MITPIKNLLRSTTIGNIIRRMYYFLRNRIISDRLFVKWMYKKNTGKHLNLKEPKTLNEKICWLKLNNRTPLHTKCADKYAVRDYVASEIGANYLIPLYFHTKKPTDINDATIKKLPCIIKTNHDSGGGIIIRNKDGINWEKVQRQLKKRLSRNYYIQSKEWQYKNIVPRILVEKLLTTKMGTIPEDFKLHVINGKVRMIQVDIGRGTNDHRRNWYSVSWEREPYKWSSPKGQGKYTDPSKMDVKKPETLPEMIRLSEKLAEPFDYVRIDWYDLHGQLYFGEITFHHDGGYQPIIPEIWDEKLGNLLHIKGL